MKMNRWLRISLLFSLPIVCLFFLFQNQSGETEKVTWSEVVIPFVVASIALCLAWTENIDKSLWSWFKKILKNISDLRRVKRKKQAGGDKKDSLKSPKSSSPSKPWSFFNKRNMKMKRKEKEKKKVNKFETYDLGVEQRIRNQWERVKRNKAIDKEENELRKFAMQLKTKRYEETDDWIWVLRNFFRARPERLQGLLFEISERIADLDEIKKIEKEKPAEPEKPKRVAAKEGKATSVPTSPSPGDHEPNSQGTNKLPKSDLEKDTDQDEQAKEDNPPSTA